MYMLVSNKRERKKKKRIETIVYYIDPPSFAAGLLSITGCVVTFFKLDILWCFFFFLNLTFGKIFKDFLAALKKQNHEEVDNF